MKDLRSLLVVPTLLAAASALAAAAGLQAPPDPGGPGPVRLAAAAGGVGALPSSPPAPPDSADALVRRAGDLEAEEPGKAARLYRRAAGLVEDGTDAWLRLSEAQAAARDGDTAAVRRAARQLEGSGMVPPDSVRDARTRAALVAGDALLGAELGRTLPGAAAPRLWAERLAPALLAAGDTAAARRGLVEAAGADPGVDVHDTVLQLAPDWRTLSRLARSERAAGRIGRAVRLLERAAEQAPGTERADLWRRRAEAELRAGRPGEAHRSAKRGLDAAVDGSTRARLEVAAARSHLARGQRSDGEVHLRRGAGAGGGERSARAGYLLADLAHDRGEVEEARERYREVADRFPRDRHGGVARMRLGLLAFRDGRPGPAVEHFRAYRRALPEGGWATASLYWEGRTAAASGRSEMARDRYREVVRRDPLSWYGIRASARLDREPLPALSDGDSARREPPPGGGDRPRAGRGGTVEPLAAGSAAGSGRERGTLPPGGDALLSQMDRLRSWGWPERALATLEAVDPDSVSGGRPLALAARLNAAGWTGPGIRLGWSVFERRGSWSLELMRVVWPLPYRADLLRAAAGKKLSPALVAAVVRQESAFEPRAVSRSGAVGLMQLMPATAAGMIGEDPDREALMRPTISLELGTRYLHSLLARFDGSLVGALVAYNAGPERWLRWRRFPEVQEDPELLIERIPFAETRRYVKAVLRNSYLYARLYGLGDGGLAAGARAG